MNKTKTWKIGEECVGGIIQAKISENVYFPSSTTVKILVKEWKTGEIIHSDIFGRIHESRLENHLHEMTTSYYASKIMEWVKENAFTHRVLVAFDGGSNWKTQVETKTWSRS
jgi:hypothetical protein